MKKKAKVLLILLLFVFFGFTFSTVMNSAFKRETVGGYDILSIRKNANISGSNVVSIDDAYDIDFKDYNSCIEYFIPLKEDNYNIKITDLEVYSTPDGITYQIAKQNDNIALKVKNNGIMGNAKINVKYKINKGEDYDSEKDSFKLVLFDSKIISQVKDLSFSVTFPKVINSSNISLYSGDKLDNENFNLTYNSNILNGYYKNANNLALSKYTELNVKFEDGYFKNVRDAKDISIRISIIYFFITLIFLVIWFFKGKDESIASKPVFYPPNDFNPLEIGYWIDNSMDYSDAFFMVLHWANEGYIKITKLSKGDDTEGKTNYVFKKVKDLNINKPSYEKKLFKALFELGKQDDVTDEFNTKIFRTETDALYGTLQTYAQDVGDAEAEFDSMIKKAELESYDKEADRIFNGLKFVSIFLWILAMYIFGITNAVSLADYMPILIALFTGFLAFFVNKEIFFTYVIYTSPILLLVSFNTLSVTILVSLLLDLFLTAIVRKRTFKYNDLLGNIFGFRNVICKNKYRSEINDIAKNHNSYFYDILPYALVLFRGKNWSKQFNEIVSPDWYNSYDGENLDKSNIDNFIGDMEILSQEILQTVNLSATADKKKVARENITYVSRNERIRNAGFDPSTFDDEDDNNKK